MKELALIRAYKFVIGEYASAVPYFVLDKQGQIIPDDKFDLYVDNKNNILQEFYGFEMGVPKITSHLYQELEYIGMQVFEDDTPKWFQVSKDKFKRPTEEGWIFEWYAVYEFESGYNSTFDGDDYWQEFTYLGQLDEINIEILTPGPIDKNDN